MKQRQKLINKWLKSIGKQTFKFAYEQGRFDEWADNQNKREN